MKFLLGTLLALLLFFSVSAQETVRIMSYNIHNGAGLDKKVDYERIAEVINQAKPDVVAVQELDSATYRSKGVDVLHELGDYTLMHRIYAPAIPYQCGKYGIGVIVKGKTN